MMKVRLRLDLQHSLQLAYFGNCHPVAQIIPTGIKESRVFIHARIIGPRSLAIHSYAQGHGWTPVICAVSSSFLSTKRSMIRIDSNYDHFLEPYTKRYCKVICLRSCSCACLWSRFPKIHPSINILKPIIVIVQFGIAYSFALAHLFKICPRNHLANNILFLFSVPLRFFFFVRNNE